MAHCQGTFYDMNSKKSFRAGHIVRALLLEGTLNYHWTKPSPLSKNGIPWSILGGGEAGPQHQPRKQTIFDNGQGRVQLCSVRGEITHFL